jgi:hypothetical protein
MTFEVMMYVTIASTGYTTKRPLIKKAKVKFQFF